jgi:methionyl-tRNA formyltransferase
METTSEPTKSEGPLQNLRIVFMGTPEFALTSLDTIVRAGCRVIGVITAPDKPAGRGMQIRESAIKKYAVEKAIPLLQPEKLKNPEFLEQVRSWKADLQAVVAFRMLPEILWSMPAMGTINLHGSLLPQYRGAAPINWAVINGEQRTGVTTFKLQQEIDTGDILLQESFPIGETETAGEVHDRMKEIGAQLLLKTIRGVADGTLRETPQKIWLNASGLTGQPLKHAPKITTETCRIDWTRSIDEIYNLIRGLSPFPAAFTDFDGKIMKIFRSHKESAAAAFSPGQFQTDKKTFLKFAASDGYIYLDEIQLEARKKLPILDFLRGYRFD